MSQATVQARSGCADARHALQPSDLPPQLGKVAQTLARLRTASEYGTDTDLVFPDWDGSHLPYPHLRAAFRTAVKAASLATIRFHALRHTFGTMCAASGIPLTTVQAYMGHAAISTTMIYAHFAPAGNEAALISRAFGAATAMPDPLAVLAA